MTKQQRQNLAKETFDKALSSGLNLEMNGQWIVISPAAKCPLEITLAMNECGDELADLVRQAEEECSPCSDHKANQGAES